MDIEWLEDSPPLEFQIPPGTSHPDTHSVKHDNKELLEEKEQQQTICQKAPKRKTKKRISQDERVPHWAYELESKRLAVEDRHTAAIEKLAVSLTKIQEDIRIYMTELGTEEQCIAFSEDRGLISATKNCRYHRYTDIKRMENQQERPKIGGPGKVLQIDEKGSIIHTDCWRAYDSLPTHGYIHKKVNHSKPDNPFIAEDVYPAHKRASGGI
ncbi:unnamed protein product [Colias eurytheme]|nr:unnamed protein product [Colias eurytheme]